jgi:ribonucleoside-triphosphate reductase
MNQQRRKTHKKYAIKDLKMNPTEVRSQIVTRRTYARPKGDTFESWEDTVDRVIIHQRWLWERAKGNLLNESEELELAQLRQLMLDKKLSTSGRTLWLGGTEVAKKRESSQFNCSYTKVETVYDVVDVLWLLLQGCGVGFSPVTGTLNGFFKPIHNIKVIRSTREVDEDGNYNKGEEDNYESFENGTWIIKVGDSAEAWAKSIGKLLAGKYNAHTLVLDFSEIRPAGIRLKGYGWISSGDESIAEAYVEIAKIMSARAGQLLTRMNILDIVNWLGTVLSSRRSAQIALFEYNQPEWEEFAIAKKDWWLTGNRQRTQSNNSLVFYDKPTKEDLKGIFNLMEEAGGSEPGFVNGQTALKRAPWFAGSNPCCEILLGNKNFCNLVEIDIAKYRDNTTQLLTDIQVAARANYRQTCVDLRDGILQEAWHLNNEFLRLCGVGLTGIARRDDLSYYDYGQLKNAAIQGAYSMADELGLQRPKNVTTVKPSGTLSKVMGTTEGVHKPLGKYIFNNINFGNDDPLLPILRDANYNVFPNPNDPQGTLVTFPVAWEDVEFTKVGEVEVNLETAVEQLERYKKLQVAYCQQNVSNTISYSPDEVDAIIDWLLDNWDIYVGVSFLYRADPTKTAEDLGYLYLPQEVVTKDKYEEYVSQLKSIELGENTDGDVEIESSECSGGHCPII